MSLKETIQKRTLKLLMVGWNSCLLEESVTAEWEATMASLDLTHSRTKRLVWVYFVHMHIKQDKTKLISKTWGGFDTFIHIGSKSL